jgi:hypothetical protein
VVKASKIFYVRDDDSEAKGFFTEDGKVIVGWSYNDGNEWPEFLDALLEHFNITIDYDDIENPVSVKELREWLGIDEEEEDNEDGWK